MTHPVRTQWIDIASGFAGYLALPPGGHGPGLVLFQEIFGVNEHIQGVAQQYALAGFVVLADLFSSSSSRAALRDLEVKLVIRGSAGNALTTRKPTFFIK